MEALLSYKNKEGVLTSDDGQRSVMALLRESYPPLGLSAGEVIAVNVDSPIGEGGHVLVECDGGLWVVQMYRVGIHLFYDLGGWRRVPYRAKLGRSVPVVLGPIEASGRAL